MGKKDSKEKLLEINKVEGFNPFDMLTKIDDADYLRTADRIGWFWLKHPEGTIVSRIEDVNENTVIFHASVYADRKDREHSLLAEASAMGFFKASGDSIYKVFEATETSAVGRALGFAGFGTQYCGFTEDGPVDSPAPKSDNLASETKPKAVDFTNEIESTKATLTRAAAFSCMTNSGKTLKCLFNKNAKDPMKEIRKIAQKTPKDSNEAYIVACAQFLVKEYTEQVESELSGASA